MRVIIESVRRSMELIASARVASRREPEREIPGVLVGMQSAWSVEEDRLVVENWNTSAVVVAFLVFTGASADDEFGLASAGESDEDLADVDVGFAYEAYGAADGGFGCVVSLGVMNGYLERHDVLPTYERGKCYRGWKSLLTTQSA